MKRTLSAFAFTLFALLAISDITTAQINYYGYEVVRNPVNGTPGWGCVISVERNVGGGCIGGGNIFYGVTYCLLPGPTPCNANVYNGGPIPWILQGYIHADQRLTEGIWTGHDRVQDANGRWHNVTWATQEGLPNAAPVTIVDVGE